MKNYSSPSTHQVIHDQFKSGQGYGSSEGSAEALKKLNEKQFGDNPLPVSGGGYTDTDEVQPDENGEDVDLDFIPKTPTKGKKRSGKNKH